VEFLLAVEHTKAQRKWILDCDAGKPGQKVGFQFERCGSQSMLNSRLELALFPEDHPLAFIESFVTAAVIELRQFVFPFEESGADMLQKIGFVSLEGQS